MKSMRRSRRGWPCMEEGFRAPDEKSRSRLLFTPTRRTRESNPTRNNRASYIIRGRVVDDRKRALSWRHKPSGIMSNPEKTHGDSVLVGDSFACWCLRSFFRFGPFLGERVLVSVLMASAMMPFLPGAA